MTGPDWIKVAFLLWLVARDFFDGPADWPDEPEE